MVETIVGLLVSIALFFGAWIKRPHSGRCPPHYALDAGIREDGVFSCTPDLTGPDARPYQPPGFYQSRIYCSGGLLPVVTDEGRRVGCRRGFYQ